MAITIKSSSTVNTGSAITLPAGIVAGDLLVLAVTGYNTQPSVPTGWTLVATGSGAGTYTEYGSLFYKVAAGTESSSSIPFGGNGTYSGAVAMVLTGADTTVAPFGSVYGGTNASTALSVNSLNAQTKPWKEFIVWAEMTDGGTLPTFSNYPSGRTVVQDVPSSQNAYHRMTLLQLPTDVASGSSMASVGATTSAVGGNVGIHFGVINANAAPIATITSPNNTFLDNRTSSVNLSWTYSDAESNPQAQYEVGYRISGLKGWVAGTPTTFNYNGGQQTYVVPAGVTKIAVTAYGAQGYNPASTVSGKGGYAAGWVPVTPGETIYVYVGGSPTSSSGGFNGGGNGNSTSGGGGGASDIRKGGTATSNRVLVAGGGGGTYYTYDTGGYGGGLTGGDGTGSVDNYGIGGTQTAGGANGGTLATGGSALMLYGGGGGGGYYGGGGARNVTANGTPGGGGGSSFIGTLENGVTYAGNTTYGRNGNGLITIAPVVWDLVDYTTTVANSSAKFITYPTNTFVDGVEYEWRVRVNDGYSWGPYATGTFTSGPSMWTYGSEVTTSTQGGSTDILSTPGNYELQVRTSDAVGYSPWSTSKSFVVQPPSNIYVRSGGAWKLSINNSRLSGAWKQLPSTKKNTGGIF